MNVLLVQPPVRDFYQTAMRTQPLGLAYLAAVIRQAGHAVSILDCQTPGCRTPLPLPDALSYLSRFYPVRDLSPFKLHTRFYHFGLSYAAIAAQLKTLRPDVVGISCQYTPYERETAAVAALAKSLDAVIPVVAGGAHASALPEQVLRDPHIDYVVLGEGERTIIELLDCISRGASPERVQGVAFRTRTGTRVNPRAAYIEDLDSLPFPARDLLDQRRYTVRGRPAAMLLTGRGCPQGCSYCSVQSVMGPRLRLRSPENIVAELRYCVEQHDISVFDIEDDHFTHDEQRARNILELIVATFGERTLELYAMNGVSLLSLTPELLRMMQRAGFRNVDLALGCTTAAEGRLMHRPVDRRAVRSVTRRIGRSGLPSTTYIIIGVPGQRLRDMVGALVLLAGLPTRIGQSVFYPSPGSALYAALQAGNSLPADFSVMRSSAFPVETRDVSRLELATLMRLARWLNWVKRMLTLHGMPSVSLGELDRIAFLSAPMPQACEASAAGATVHLPAPLAADEAGRLLSGWLLRHRSFFGLRRVRSRAEPGYVYEFFPYDTAATVMERFLEASERMRIAAAPCVADARRACTVS